MKDIDTLSRSLEERPIKFFMKEQESFVTTKWSDYEKNMQSKSVNLKDILGRQESGQKVRA